MVIRAKGQITGQVFIYIAAIVVIGLLFFLGYNYVGELLGQKCKTDKALFIQSIQDAIDQYDGFNSLQNKFFAAPCSYTEVCFVDARAVRERRSSSVTNAIIAAGVSQGIENTIFLVGKSTEPVAFAEKVRVENDFICIHRENNQFKVQFRGNAGTTTIGTFDD